MFVFVLNNINFFFYVIGSSGAKDTSKYYIYPHLILYSSIFLSSYTLLEGFAVSSTISFSSEGLTRSFSTERDIPSIIDDNYLIFSHLYQSFYPFIKASTLRYLLIIHISPHSLQCANTYRSQFLTSSPYLLLILYRKIQTLWILAPCQLTRV